jgi:hypothetical protein
MITIALKDAVSARTVLYEQHTPGRSAWSFALERIQGFFDEEYAAYAKSSPREFALFFASQTEPPMLAKVNLIVRNPEADGTGAAGTDGDNLFDLHIDVPELIALVEFPAKPN